MGLVAVVIAAAATKSVFGSAPVRPKYAINKYGAAVHSHFAGQELDLICNHNFV